VFLVAEIFCDGHAREADTKTRTGRFGHLAVNQRGARFFGVSGFNDMRFGHFQPQVVSFARAFTDTGKHRQTTVLHGNVVNQLKNQHRLAHARAAEQPDFSALHVWLHQVHDLDAGLEHFQVGGLIFQSGGWAVNGIVGVGFDGSELVNRLAEHVHHAAERRATDGNSNRLAGVECFHAADHSLGWFHGHGADASITKVLLHFRSHVQRFRHVVAFAADADGVVDRRQVPGFKLNVQDWANHLDHVSDCCILLGHLQPL